MGLSNSTNLLIKNEQLAWAKSHTLDASDADLCSQYRALVDAHFTTHDEISLCAVNCEMMGIIYSHYFVANKHFKWVLEFGGGSVQDNTVDVRRITHREYRVVSLFKMSEEVRHRMHQVVGATNYSLALRNCEHVARYVHCGGWLCTQMCTEAVLYKVFAKYLMGESKRISNLRPQELEEFRVMRPLYPGQEGCIMNGQKVQAHNYSNDAFNVVFIGPTGCGKSSLINQLFNKDLCEVGGGAASVTYEFATYIGDARVNGVVRRMIVTDTIGFCDSAIGPKEVLILLKEFLKCNYAFIDRLVVVCSGRIEKAHQESITQILEWLKYYESAEEVKCNVCFVYNKANLCSGPSEVVRNVATMGDMLRSGMHVGVYRHESRKVTLPLNMAIGIPPSASYEEGQEQLKDLKMFLLRKGGERQQIRVEPDTMCIIL